MPNSAKENRHDPVPNCDRGRLQEVSGFQGLPAEGSHRRLQAGREPSSEAAGHRARQARETLERFLTVPAKLLLSVLSVLLSMTGCSANMREVRGSSAYAPQNEGTGGRVNYLADGADFAVLARREDAYRQMSAHCSGNYEISREWDEEGPEVTSAWGDGSSRTTGDGTTNSRTTSSASATSFSTKTKYRNIEFACSPPKNPNVRVPAGARLKSVSTSSTRRPLADSEESVTGNREAAPEIGRADTSGKTGTETHGTAQVQKPSSNDNAESASGNSSDANGGRVSIVEVLSLDTGCDPKNILTVRSAVLGRGQTGHRMTACGRTYYCVETLAGVACRLALTDGVSP